MEERENIHASSGLLKVTRYYQKEQEEYEERERYLRGSGTFVEQLNGLGQAWEWYRSEKGRGKSLLDDEADFVFRKALLYVTRGFRMDDDLTREVAGYSWRDAIYEDKEWGERLGRNKVKSLNQRADYLCQVAKGHKNLPGA